jgi:prolyl oligopeptidase
VFDGDTRVDPLHARKMAAALQSATSADPDDRPILVRSETDVGHGARAVARAVELAADQLSFLAAQLRLSTVPSP